jgi:hypothetical protein
MKWFYFLSFNLFIYNNIRIFNNIYEQIKYLKKKKEKE